MKSLTPGQSRLLALVLLFIVVLVLVRVLLLPVWSSWSDYSDKIGSLERRIEVYDRLISSVPEDRERLAQLQASLPSRDWYLAESTPALAAANLQQMLHLQVARSGGQVISTQIINAGNDGPLQAVGIQVHLRGEINDLVDLLYTLESGQPILFVDNLTVVSNPRRQATSRRSQLRGRIQEIPSLNVRFDLLGYAQREKDQ